MDWNGNYRVLPDSSFSFLCNYNYELYPAEMKQQTVEAGMLATVMERRRNQAQDEKKKRLSNEQLESLEKSFQEDIKLDPDRKLRLAGELSLRPRQIAIWFQNRRARWKAKQLERLYHALKHEYDAVSRDKQKLQQEVIALKAILKDHMAKKQALTTGCCKISTEETVESTTIPFSDKPHHRNLDRVAECNAYGGLDIDDDYKYNVNNNAVMIPATSYWPS